MKVVFSDIDGTLLDSKHRVHRLHLKAVETLSEKNIPFVIVSARSAPCIYPILDEAGFNCCIIACGGAVILNENREKIYEKGLEKNSVRKIVDFINTLKNDVVINLYSEDQWITDKKHDERVKLEESIVGVNSVQGNIDDIEADKVDKILCMINNKELNEFENQIKLEFPELSVVKSSEEMLEIMNIGVTKAEACKQFCTINEIEIDQAAAFGDNYNDIDMLESVGYGYLMENAPEELKNRFINITKSNDEAGIYHKLVELKII